MKKSKKKVDEKQVVEKLVALKEISKKELDKCLKRTNQVIKELRPEYAKLIQGVKKEKDIQTQAICFELLIQSIAIDSQIPPFLLLGILDKVKHDLRNRNFPMPFTFKKEDETPRSYVG